MSCFVGNNTQISPKRMHQKMYIGKWSEIRTRHNFECYNFFFLIPATGIIHVKRQKRTNNINLKFLCQ